MSSEGVTVCTSLADAYGLAASWDALADQAGAGPLVRPGFVLPWWEHVGSGTLHLVTVHDDAGLAAVAPLHRRRLGPVEVVRFLGHGLGTVGEVVVRPGHDAAADAVWKAAAGPRRALQLVEYRHGGGGLRGLRQAPQLRVEACLRDVCPVLDLDLATSDPLAALLSTRRNLRRTLARADKDLAAADLAFEVETVRTPQRLVEVLPEVEAVLDAAEFARPRLHLLRGEWRSLGLALLHAAARDGRLQLGLARLDGRPAAVDVAFADARAVAVWYGRFDPAAARYSPGHLLLRFWVRTAAASRVPRVDLLLGDDAYKRRWATGYYDTLDVLAAPPALHGPMRGLLRAAELGRRLRPTPRARSTAASGSALAGPTAHEEGGPSRPPGP